MMALITLLTAGLRNLTDAQFDDLLAALHRELAPTTALEGILVGRILTCAGRLRRAARLEEQGQPLNSLWLRYEAMAERGFWKALNAIEKGRKPQGKAREKASAMVVEVAPVPVPTPPAQKVEAPAPAPATPAAAPRPVPSPAPKAAPVPKPAPAPAPAKRPEPKFLRDLGKRRPPQRPLPPFPPAQPGAVLNHVSITPAPKHRVDDRPWPFEI